MVIDLFSLQVLGWSARDDMTSNLVTDALRMAWFRRHPDRQAGLLCCCNQGSQYASGACRNALNKYGCTAFKAR